jgi:hypothetical protein
MIRQAEKVVTSPIVGAALLVASAIFITVRWAESDLSVIRSADPRWLISGAVSYTVALLSLAGAGFHRLEGRVISTVFEAQLYKYVPGGVWQSRPLLRAGGVGLVGRYALATLVSAVLAIALVTTGPGRVAVVALVAIVTLVSMVRLGPVSGLRFITLATLTVSLIAGSGACVAMAVGLSPFDAARAVAGGWGAGVLAVPVPGGLGVREAAIMVVGGSDAAALAAIHRLVTLTTDVVLGAGVLVLSRR